MNRMASVIAASITTVLAGTAVVAALTSEGVVGGDGAPKTSEARVVVVDSATIDSSQPVPAGAVEDIASPDDPYQVDDPDEVDDQAEAADDPDEVDDDSGDARELEPHDEDDDED